MVGAHKSRCHPTSSCNFASYTILVIIPPFPTCFLRPTLASNMHQMAFPNTFTRPTPLQRVTQLHWQGTDHASRSIQFPAAERIDPSSLLNTFGNKKKKHLLPAGFEPNNFTVLVGRTRECQDHAGNRRLKSIVTCLLYTSPSPRDLSTSRMPSSA